MIRRLVAAALACGRITWEPRRAGYAQTIDRSTDAGTTWTFGSTVTYER